MGIVFVPAYFPLFLNTLAEKLQLVDWINAIIFLAGSALLAVILTFGDIVYMFHSGATITGILLIAFIILLKLHPLVARENRLYSVHVFRQPTLNIMQLQIFLFSGVTLCVFKMVCLPISLIFFRVM
ncbi:efflux pump DEP3 [Colletotrichum liriopes]|uniref:Efflux pump DEP3 n=1 Tax=Colletotrichum liriopes TaxID=708192 RepID=A0AA37GVR4_9PEZI|nr:efflux pump DEP3 [Colletotrichum liriopes]